VVLADKTGKNMGCMNEEEQEDEILALSEILPPSTLTVERLGPASHSGTLQVFFFLPGPDPEKFDNKKSRTVLLP
jgi:hypothetical protein